ncbi:hypothetical protein [Jeotgalibaca caeni]|uniref:hypothetical protein n=1 Tax=Jeotgalibaca caeni TaxID=3028623 RepID=UPI00237DDB08|nr:hypothetical protein [Jeotgalibaca caeni]MDE1548986.1 hypothetical protein [Jeotgalibaca caeni]
MIQTKRRTRTLTVSALLIAIGILIPMVSPLKIVLPPASFTLASHVATFIAMFISPYVAIMVAFGTAMGFLLGGFPIVITLRALSHLVFAYIGGNYLASRPDFFQKRSQVWFFNFLIGILHALCEVVVVSFFYFSGNLSEGYYDQGLLFSVMGLVGVGTVIHSMVDFWLAELVWKSIPKKNL